MLHQLDCYDRNYTAAQCRIQLNFMGIQQFLENLINLIGTYSHIAGASLFVLCLITEVFIVSVPYLLETTLMLTGYSISSGGHAIYNLVTIILMTMMGRLLGILITYAIATSSGRLIAKLRSFLQSREHKIPFVNRIVDRINLVSPFSVAAGRLLGLRYPVTILMSAQKRLKTLLLGAALSSLIYDGFYVIIGAIIGTNATLKPLPVMIAFTIGLTLLYISIFVGRYLWQRRFR